MRVIQGNRRWMRCVAALSITTALAGIPCISEVYAAEVGAPSYRFAMASQPLSVALHQFADMVSIQIIFSEDLVRDMQAPAVQGTYTADKALQVLLTGSGLEIERSPSGTFMVRRSPSRSAARAVDFTEVAMEVAQAASPTSVPAAAREQAAQAPAVEEVVVTGSRIVRQGYEAPTPVSVISADALRDMALPNVADAVNRLPQVQGSLVATNSSHNVSDGGAGLNNINLRNLQSVRTLVLMDGRRMVGSTIGGYTNNGNAVDVNNIPSDLVARVDVVTGGASAVYGSDALAGVVNFVLDKEFTGFKGTAQGGITTYGDDPNYKLSLAAGVPFAADRGHFLIDAELHYNRGIEESMRPWNADNDYNFMVNPAYGTGAGQSTSVPQYLAMDHVGTGVATGGGLIVSGPLKGIQFGQDGKPMPFTFGSIVSSPYMSGGDWKTSRMSNRTMLDVHLVTENIFTHVGYDLSDDFRIFGEWQWSSNNEYSNPGFPDWRLGNNTVTVDNAFLPESVRTQMQALHLTSFTLGTFNEDLLHSAGWKGAGNNDTRIFRRYMGGAEGGFDAMDTRWKWDASVGYSTTHSAIRSVGNVYVAKYVEAIDAVVQPGTGKIVCRSTLTNPNNGCVPYDQMGIGVNSQQAMDYVTGTGYSVYNLSQTVMAANVSGEPFSTWAGPLSVATGLEHRREAVNGWVSPEDQTNQWFLGNYKATNGSFSVTEGYVEILAPLAKNTPWAKSLDLNAAIRATGYSVSGYVTTWKVGAVYNPIDDITFRATRSRDIRAPNLGDLYSGGNPSHAIVVDPFRGGEQNASFTQASVGNTALVPEKADTTGLGVVLQPTFLRGFGASVDYYNINIGNAISQLDAQTVMNNCYAGQAIYCSYITRDPAGPGQQYGLMTYMANRKVNVLQQQTSGLDIEASYSFPLASLVDSWDGNLEFRALANKVFKLNSTNSAGQVIEGAGVVSNPQGNVPLSTIDFRYTASVAYRTDMFSGTITMRGKGPGKYSDQAIVCTSGCPVSTALAPTYNLNHIDAFSVFDLGLTYQVMQTTQMFLSIDNLFNRYPPIIYSTTASGFYSGIAGVVGDYDPLGRVFRVGVRFKA